MPVEQIAISISDTGIGIAPKDIERIFGFCQANQTITRQHGGMGLGLAVSDRLVKLMQGQISVESQPNRGSTFTVILPCQLEKP